MPLLRKVFEAFTTPELFKRWWVPKSFGLNLLSCELDVRVGGGYRLVFGHGWSSPTSIPRRKLSTRRSPRGARRAE
jgi:hypothetical protein